MSLDLGLQSSSVGSIAKSQVDDKLANTQAKANALQGIEGVWIKARRDNCFYVLNKIISMVIAISFAIITITFKQTTQAYYAQIQAEVMEEGHQNRGDAEHYLLIYWLLFLYLSLQAMDELIELFSVMMQLEKGALGLFFEMNYFVGLGLAIYIFWFLRNFEAPKMDADIKIQKLITGELIQQQDYNMMYNWLFFHMIYTIISVLLSITVFFIYKNINDKVANKIVTKSSKTDDNFKKETSETEGN